MSGKKLTVKEIIKALEYWKKFDNEIDQMLSGRFKDDKMLIEQKEIVKITLNLFDLINRQKAIIEKSEKVEHFADKTIETANAEIEELVGNNDKLNIELQSMRSAANSLKMHYEEAQTKIDEFMKKTAVTTLIDDAVVYTTTIEDFKKFKKKFKSEAVKEFAEKVENEIDCQPHSKGLQESAERYRIKRIINNILKEMVSETENKIALLPINQKELSHLINDIISYIWKLEDRGCATEEFGYISRKKLLEKLKQFEKENFEMFVECQKELVGDDNA